MEQTFNDLCRERQAAGEGLFAVAGWVFIDTFAGIIRERITMIMMQNSTKRLTAYRAAVGVAVAAVLLLVWFNAAVGTEDDNSGGLMYFGVLVLGIAAIIARFRPQGMARALFATALAQALVALIAMIAWQQYFELLILNGFFIALFVGSAWLFRKAAREQTHAGAVPEG